MIENLEVVAGWPEELPLLSENFNEYYKYCMYVNKRIYHVSEKGRREFAQFIFKLHVK